MKVKLQCPDCHEKFVHIGDDMPEVCPICDAYVGSKGKPEIAMPAFLTPRAQTADNLYREMERGAEHRAQMAAQITGQPASEFSDTRITNLQSAVHQGAVAAAPVVNEVTHRMDHMRSTGVPAGFTGGGVQHSGAVSQGPFPNAGLAFTQILREQHAMSADPRQGPITSSNPAVEVTNPLYRPRIPL